MKYTIDYKDVNGAPCFVVTDLITHAEQQAGEDYFIVHLMNGAEIKAYSRYEDFRKNIEFSKRMRES